MQTIINVSNTLITQHTLPIYERDKSSDYRLCGTGVFIRFRGNYIILTASHVVIDMGDRLVVTEAGSVSIDGQIFASNENSEDTAFIILSDEFGELLARTRAPLPEHLLGANTPDNLNHPHLIFGYPERKSKLANGVLSSSAIGITTYISKRRVYNAYNRNPAINYIFDLWKGKNLDGSKMKMKRHSELRSLNGMSGCGIWHVGIMRIGDQMRTFYGLLGIMNQSYKQRPRYNVIIGTKIDRYLDAFDHLAKGTLIKY